MKWLLSGLIAVVAIVLVALVVGYFTLDGVTRRGIEQGTSYATGTPARLDAAELSIRRGELKLSSLEIGNPEGFTSPHFLQLGEGEVAVTLGSLLRDEVEVPRLHLRGLDLNLERRDGQNNYDVILANLEKLKGDPEDQPEDGKKYVIREIVISDVVVKAALLPSTGEPRVLTVTIPDIRLADVGSDTDNGVLMSQVSGIVLQAVMQAVMEQAGDILPAAIASGLQSSLAGLGELGNFGMESIGSGAGQVLSDITGHEAVNDALDGMSGAVGGALEGAGQAVGEKAGQVIEDAGEAAREGADRVRENIGNILGGNRNRQEQSDEEAE